MKTKSIILVLTILAQVLLIATVAGETDQYDSTTIINLEKAALDRWGKGDPKGYIEIFAPDITYFNPFEERRIDGLVALAPYYDAVTGLNSIDRYDMIDPKVQWVGDVAILSYHLYNYKRQADGTEKETTRWNSTKVYVRMDNAWKIIHNHWSFLQPEIGATLNEE